MKRSLFAIVFFCATPCWADMSPVENQYVKDRNEAIEQYTPDMGASCLKDLSDKKQHEVQPVGEAAYNDSISRGVYKTVFWNHSDRGVAFTIPVKADTQKGEVAGDVACLYSVRGKQLYFELSQQLF